MKFPERRNHPTATVPKPVADELYAALKRIADRKGPTTPAYVAAALELYERELAAGAKGHADHLAAVDRLRGRRRD